MVQRRNFGPDLWKEVLKNSGLDSRNFPHYWGKFREIFHFSYLKFKIFSDLGEKVPLIPHNYGVGFNLFTSVENSPKVSPLFLPHHGYTIFHGGYTVSVFVNLE
jgi:hypothetical protein